MIDNTCGVDSTVVDINVQCKNAIIPFLHQPLVKKQVIEGLMRRPEELHVSSSQNVH